MKILRSSASTRSIDESKNFELDPSNKGEPVKVFKHKRGDVR